MSVILLLFIYLCFSFYSCLWDSISFYVYFIIIFIILVKFLVILCAFDIFIIYF